MLVCESVCVCVCVCVCVVQSKQEPEIGVYIPVKGSIGQRFTMESINDWRNNKYAVLLLYVAKKV